MSEIRYTPPNAPSGPTGSGAAGQVTFWSADTVLTGSNNLFWDSINNRLGIGNSAPGVRLDIHGTGVIQQLNGTTTNSSYLDFQNAGATKWRLGNTYNAGQNRFSIFSAGATFEVITTFQTGNVSINSTTDAGWKLDVNGTTRVTGELRAGFLQLLSSGTAGGTGQGIVVTGYDSTFQLQGSSSPTDMFIFRSYASLTQTSQLINVNKSVISIYGGFSDGNINNLSGNTVNITPTYNFAGTRTGIVVRGIYYNPSLTSLTNTTHRAIETTTGDVLLGTTSGTVGIGVNTSINASAILDITSTTKGVLFPRMTNAQRTSISSPAIGLIVYCTDAVEGLYIYKSTGWTFII
jgi:hypothetical protein